MCVHFPITDAQKYYNTSENHLVSLVYLEEKLTAFSYMEYESQQKINFAFPQMFIAISRRKGFKYSASQLTSALQVWSLTLFVYEATVMRQYKLRCIALSIK